MSLSGLSYMYKQGLDLACREEKIRRRISRGRNPWLLSSEETFLVCRRRSAKDFEGKEEREDMIFIGRSSAPLIDEYSCHGEIFLSFEAGWRGSKRKEGNHAS